MVWALLDLRVAWTCNSTWGAYIKRTPKDIRLAAERAQALADPTRLSIALILRDAQPAPVTVSKIAEKIGRDRGLVSRHCAKLHEAGLLTKTYKRSYLMGDDEAAVVDAVMRTS